MDTKNDYYINKEKNYPSELKDSLDYGFYTDYRFQLEDMGKHIGDLIAQGKLKEAHRWLKLVLGRREGYAPTVDPKERSKRTSERWRD